MGELSYTDTHDPTWAITALKTIEVSAGPATGEADYVDVAGTCPRCGHPLVPFRHWLVAILGVDVLSAEQLSKASQLLRGEGLMPDRLDAEFPARCTCEVAHPDPANRTGLTGCGARWPIRVVSE